jgi:hypothetical protein
MTKRGSGSGIGWLLVGVVLVLSGAQHIATKQLLGRVYVSGTPVLEGGVVVVIGCLELAAGTVLVWRWFRGR